MEDKIYKLDSRFSLVVSYENSEAIQNVVLCYQDEYTSKEYLLTEKTPEEILKLRIDPDVVGFVFKPDSRYFFTDLGMPTYIYIGYEFGEHLCGKCSRCSAAEDPKGCKKVRDRVPEAYSSKMERDKVMKISKRLEKYGDFIKCAIEVFNNGLYSHFVVNCCAHFRPDEVRKRKTKTPKYISKTKEEQSKEPQAQEGQAQEEQPKKPQDQEGQAQKEQPKKPQAQEGQAQEEQPKKPQAQEEQAQKEQPKEPQAQEGQAQEEQPKKPQDQEGQPKEPQVQKKQPKESRKQKSQIQKRQKMRHDQEEQQKTAREILDEMIRKVSD